MSLKARSESSELPSDGYGGDMETTGRTAAKKNHFEMKVLLLSVGGDKGKGKSV